MAETAWPFVGREVELGAARAVLAARGALVVAGEAGVGKSRFVRELVARADGDPTVVVASASARDIPLGAFASALGPPTDDAADLPGVQRALRELRHRRGPLLVDDAHVLDDVSATVVGQLAVEHPVPLVLAVRSGEPAPAAVTTVWKDGLAERIELAPLVEAQAGRLLRAALGGELDALSERGLIAASRGNVLWLRHLVEGERAAGRLAVTAGVWRWRGLDGLPPALGELVAQRVGELTDAERRVLETVALGEPLGLDLLSGLGGPDAIESVAQRGLISVAADGARSQVRIGHPLYGEAVRAELSVPRARRLRGELSAALGRTGGRRADDGLRRAVLDLGSDRTPEPDMLIGAAVQAAGLGDFALAERLWRAACEGGGGFEARLGLAQLMTHLLRNDEAVHELALATAQAATDDQRVRVAGLRAVFLFFMLARREEAFAVLADADARIGEAARAAMLGARAMLTISIGDVTEAHALGTAALAHDDLPAIGVAYASWGVGHAIAFTGAGGPLGSLVERGLAAARRGPETAAMQANIGFCEIVDADLRGEPEAARHRLEWVHALTGMSAPTLGAIYDARMALAAGLPRTAIRLLDTAVPYFPGYGGGWTLWLQAMIARCHGMLGDAPGARRALALAETGRHPDIAMLDWELDLARGWVCAAEGSGRDAVRHVLRGAQRAGVGGMAPVEVLLRQTALRFGDRGQAPRLTRLADDLGTPRARLAARHARALARSENADLLVVATELEEAGMGLEAADAAAQAASLSRATGDLTSAARAEQRARALSVDGDDAQTPAVREATVPLPISERERAVATLAAEGLSNREIAQRMTVSVRTVESHIYRAYTRLGLADRAALVAVVVPPPAPRADVP